MRLITCEYGTSLSFLIFLTGSLPLNDHMSDEQFEEWLIANGMTQPGDRKIIKGYFYYLT